MYGMAILIFVFLLLAFLLWMLLQTCPPLLLLFKRWDRYRFEIRAELIGKIENMRDIDVFVLSMRGRIISRCNHCDTDVQIQMFDVTDGVKRPLRIFCADPHMQKDASAEFFSQAHNNVIPARNVILTRWRSIIELKSETLRFPCRGQRRLLFITRICEMASGRKLVEAKTRVDYFVAVEEGYLDFRQRQERILTAGWIVAKQTAAQSIKPPQQQLLEQWLNRNAVHKSLSETIDPDLFAANDAIETLHKACHVLINQSDTAFRYELMILCLRIAEAGKPVGRAKQDWLRTLAATLEIASDRFRQMYQKYLPLDAQEDPDPAFILGIDDSLSSDELANRLTEEYRKWNSRVNHPDPQIRRQADEMLSYLTDVRGRLSVQTT
jgi:hypothetical protein